MAALVVTGRDCVVGVVWMGVGRGTSLSKLARGGA